MASIVCQAQPLAQLVHAADVTRVGVAVHYRTNRRIGPSLSITLQLNLSTFEVLCGMIQWLQCIRIRWPHPPPWPGHSFPVVECKQKEAGEIT